MIRSLVAATVLASCCCQVQAERPDSFLDRMNPARFFQRSGNPDAADRSDIRTQQATLRENNAAENVNIEALPPEARDTVANRNPRRPFWKLPLFRGERDDNQSDRLAGLRERLEERGLDPDAIDARIDRVTAARMRRRPDTGADDEDAARPNIQGVRDRIAARRASMVEKMQENPNVSDTALQRLASLPDVPVARGHEPGTDTTPSSTPRARTEAPSRPQSNSSQIDTAAIRDRMQGRGLTADRIEARMARINARGGNRR